ncbi:MAG: polyprenyl synthetase family protein [Anaerovoracaceae bacterium]|jgi:heptaprenyl diphosphate synthase
MGFWTPYGNMEEKIQRVREIIASQLKHVRGPAREVIEHLLETEGKYLRAGITILSAEMGGCTDDRPYIAAAGLEMLHMATLVHDDIIDEARMRRKSLSVQQKFGKDVAVYTGDFLLARAYRFMAEEWAEISKKQDSQEDDRTKWDQVIWFSRGIEKICLGEMRQNMFRGTTTISYRDYLRIITGKTATLFAICGSAGVVISHMDRKKQSILVNSLKHMGIAFQIRDDCNDYLADEGKLGKEPLNDLMQGIYTLPLIYALEKEPMILPILEKEELSKSDQAYILEVIQETGSMKKALGVGSRYMDKALAGLEKMGDSREAETMKQVYLYLGRGLKSGHKEHAALP